MKTSILARKQRTIPLIVGIGCVCLLLAAGIYATFINRPYPSHAATASSWVENFAGNSLNSSFWNISSGTYSMGAINNLHQGYFQPDRISVGGGYITLTLTQEKGQVGSNQNGVISRGGEIETQKAYGYGTYEWRMRTSSTASSPVDTTGKVVSGQISSGFTYINNSQTELDFEVEGQRPDAAEMTTWHNTHPSTDPTASNQIETDTNVAKMANEFKTYKLVWSAGEVKYYVDGTLVADHTSQTPSVAADVLVNHWGTDSTDFGGPATVGITRYLLVDWIRYTAPGDTPLPIGTATPTPQPTIAPTATIQPTVAPTTVPSTPTPGSASPNLLKNGSFEDGTLSPWYFITTGSASGSAKLDNATYHAGTASALINVKKGNKDNFWYIQFGQANVPFTRGKTYTITFWAKASATRAGQLYIQLDAQPWTDYLVQDFSLGTDWQHYSYTFTPPLDIADAEFNFNVGQARGSVWIDSASVHQNP